MTLLNRIPFRRKTTPPSSSHLSVLDLPVAEYDPVTHLPASIQVGKHTVRPFISVAEVRDHLTLIAAFHDMATTAGERFHRVTDSAAFAYEGWASTVLPAVRRKPRSVSDSASSPPESPLSEVSSATSSSPSTSHSSTSSGSGSAHSATLQVAELPPLPVLMCWHAHLLNPAQFAVDSDGTYAWLHALPFPLAAAAAAVRAGSLPAELPHVSHHVDRPCPTIGGWSPPDISAAVQRLARRIHQLADLGWLEPAYITGDAAPIQAGIVRYHAWLDLMAAIPDHRFVAPASDIMLSWATHATHGARFLRDTARISGDDEPLDRPIDRAEQDHEAIKRASILWRARFRHEYVHRRAPVRRSTV